MVPPDHQNLPPVRALPRTQAAVGWIPRRHDLAAGRQDEQVVVAGRSPPRRAESALGAAIIDCLSEPFAASPYKSLYRDLYGLINICDKRMTPGRINQVCSSPVG